MDEAADASAAEATAGAKRKRDTIQARAPITGAFALCCCAASGRPSSGRSKPPRVATSALAEEIRHPLPPALLGSAGDRAASRRLRPKCLRTHFPLPRHNPVEARVSCNPASSWDSRAFLTKRPGFLGGLANRMWGTGKSPVRTPPPPPDLRTLRIWPTGFGTPERPFSRRFRALGRLIHSSTPNDGYGGIYLFFHLRKERRLRRSWQQCRVQPGRENHPQHAPLYAQQIALARSASLALESIQLTHPA